MLLRRLGRRVVALLTWHRRDRDMEREMAFHVDSLRTEFMRDGMSNSDAERAARRRFGSVLRAKERGHDVRSAPAIEAIVRDLQLAIRGLRRAPAFSATVILTLGLGIGGNTAIFSIVDQLLLRPLPYPRGDELVRIYERSLLRDPNSPIPERYSNGISPANWLDWQRRTKALEHLAVFYSVSRTLTGAGDPEHIPGLAVSWEFFEALGVAPLLGRVVSSEDDRPKAPAVAVLSFDLWQRRFGGDRNVVGRSIRLDDRDVEVIGVMPAGFRFLYQDVGFWGPFQLNRDLAWRDVAGRFIDVVARRRADVTPEAARGEMEAIARELTAHPMNRNMSVTLVPLREELTGQVRGSLLMLYAAVAVLLGIACFNALNLLVARATSRRQEFSVRTALGAGRTPIIRLLLTESVVLSLAGGLVGVAVARWSVDALVAFAPPAWLTVPELRVDGRVLVYALGVSLLTGLLVGLVPAVSVARRSLMARLRENSANVTASARLRQALVGAQVALTVVLLCGAGLLIRTVTALDGADSGIDRRNVATMAVVLPPQRYPGPRLPGFFDEVLDSIRALPGVEAAGAGNSLPIVGSPRGGTAFHRLGTPVPAPGEPRPSVGVRVVTTGYFRTLRVPVLRGREFDETDAASGSAPGFIVNETFVREHLAGIDPLTVSIQVEMQRPNPHRPIVGVVGDVAEGSVRRTVGAMVYYSHHQMPAIGMTFVIRTAQPAAVSSRAIALIREHDPNLAVAEVQTVEDALTESIARERLNALVSAAFAGTGLLLACLGLYGLLSFLVAERTKEFGIRITLGARSPGLMASVLSRGLVLVGAGAGVGVAAALWLSRAIRPVLFGIEPYDLPTYAAAIGILFIVAVTACVIPARRAARIEPLTALRQE